MLSCPRNIKNVLSLESDIKVDDRHINKTKEIILGYGADQHTKTEFLNFLFFSLHGKYFLVTSPYTGKSRIWKLICIIQSNESQSP